MIQFRWFFIAGVITFLTSCTPVALKDKLTCEIPDIKNNVAKSDKLKVAIYVDGSGSMLGYVKDGETNYVKALKAIRNLFELTGKLPVEYYRNGNPNQKITGGEYYSYGGSPIFYDGSNAKFKAVSSPIDAAIIAPDKNEDKMTVIITDLEQNSGDVTKLTKKIQEVYFNEDRKNYAVGIWAIKSEFNGTVYLQESNNLKTFAYNTGKQSDKFRPFYVLVIGPYNDIQYYFEQLQKYDSQQLMANSNLIIFHSENVIQNISSLDNSLTSLPKGVTRPISLVKAGVSVTKGNGSELLQIDNRQQDNVTINYSVPFLPSQYSLFFDTDTKSITSKVEVEKFDQFDKKFNPVAASDINSAIQLQNWQILDKENKLTFSALIEPNKFPEPGVYKFKFDMFAERLKSPSWWRQWDWQSRSSEQDGSKTHNLEEFLIGLKNRTETLRKGESNNTRDNNLLIGRFCYGIQKN
ncbi:hypothetical protein VB620_18305 [Nodularia harveyana UHCC-0300]|uniref:VWFA domain-containing protein n=1 Tax=Nodularia harveyana UHCC-0300 TaxID=2974287 RepID=A0ABU5UIF8_9CYAN|nr:hypothetical protein [Nodularia harveyana]MEA5583285.1 hypothetical protein [Nodularia harveyana UHCC-0300]